MLQQLKQELGKLPEKIPPEDLNMSNLIQFPQGIFKMLIWMVRRHDIQVKDLAEYIQEDEPTTQAFLETLVERGLVAEHHHDVSPKYEVNIRSSRNYRVPGEIWKVVDE